MDQELLKLMTELKSDLVKLQTELVLIKFAVEKIEQQTEELVRGRVQPEVDPFKNPNFTVEKF